MGACSILCSPHAAPNCKVFGLMRAVLQNIHGEGYAHSKAAASAMLESIGVCSVLRTCIQGCPSSILVLFPNESLLHNTRTSPLYCYLKEKICSLEREYRDCIKNSLGSQGISDSPSAIYIMCMSLSSLGNCTIYSTWCIRYAL